MSALRRLTRRVLVTLAREAGVRGPSRLRKTELVRAVAAAQAKGAPAGRPAAAADWQDAPLPDAYGEDRLVLLCIDPYWVHAYWELAGEALGAAEAKGRTGRRVLRVYDVTFIIFDGSNAHSVFDIEVTPEARNWYVNLWSPGKSLCAELGQMHADGTFEPRVRSNVIQTPPAWASPEAEPEWMVVEGRLARPATSPRRAPRREAPPAAGLAQPEEAAGGPARPSPGAGRPIEAPFATRLMRPEEYRRFLEELPPIQVSEAEAGAPAEPIPIQAPRDRAGSLLPPEAAGREALGEADLSSGRWMGESRPVRLAPPEKPAGAVRGKGGARRKVRGTAGEDG